MNIEKQTGDLSFKYLDMSKYFEKPIQKIYISLSSEEVLNAIDVRAVKLHLNNQL
jgi:hypothetical protein